MRVVAGWLAVLVMTAVSLVAQTKAPEYEVRGHTLLHKTGGGYRISLANDLKYVSASRFNIRKAADAEVHLFARANASGHIERLVWIQVENELPGQTWKYEYPSPDRVKLGDLQFITDAGAFLSYASDDPTSDHAVVDRELEKHKLTWDSPVLGIRMVYLPDAERRRELMIIYAEALPQSEAVKFRENEADANRWPKELAKLKADAMRDVIVKLTK